MEALVEGLKKLLKYEKKKLILPAFLIAVFFFWIVADSVAYPYVASNTPVVVDNALNTLKLTVYNASVNGTDKAIDDELIASTETAKKLPDPTEIMNSMVPIFGSEIVLNSFGIPYCFPQSGLSYYRSDFCITSRSFGKALIQINKLICEAASFTGEATAALTALRYTNTDTVHFSNMRTLSESDIAYNLAYIHSNPNPFQKYDTKCLQGLENVSLTYNVGLISNPVALSLPTATMVILALFAEGYFISSVLISACNKYKEHRLIVKVQKNEKGNLLYASIRKKKRFNLRT